MRFSIQKREPQWLHCLFSVRTFVSLFASRPRGTTNLAGPCVVQLKVDPLRTQCGVIQHVTQHLSLIGSNEFTMFQ